MHKGKDETVKYTYITYAGVYSFIKYQDTVTKFLLVTPWAKEQVKFYYIFSHDLNSQDSL